MDAACFTSTSRLRLGPTPDLGELGAHCTLAVSVGVVPVVEPARSVASRLRLVGLHAVGLIGLALCNASLVGVPSFASSFPVLCGCHCVVLTVRV